MKIKNILILGSFNAGALEIFYKQGFEKCGITVDTCDIADQYYTFLNRSRFNKVINKLSPDFYYKKINERLLVFLNKKKYDVILVFKGMELFPATVEELKNHAVLTTNYNADHPFIFFFPGSGNNHVRKSIPHYDVHFSYARKIVEQLQSRFNKQAYCIPFGYNSNVAVSAGRINPLYINRLLLIGAFDEQRAIYLNKLQSDLLDIYGDSKWSSRNVFRPYIRNAYRKRGLYHNDYSDAIASSMGILNLLREQNILEGSHNMRTFEVPGYGGLLVSQRTAEQQEYFEEDKEIMFFGSTDELKDKLSYLSAHPEAVHSIKMAAHSRSIREDYSYNNRSRQLLYCLENHF